MSILNKYVDKVYVINLDKDVDRMKKLDAQLKANGIEYTRFSAVNGSKVIHSKYLTEYCNTFCTDGMKGCALSHRAIWEDVVANNYSHVCILEDDAHIADNFNEEFDKSWKQLSKKYDIFYLGCGMRCTDTAPIPTLINTIQGTTPEVVSKNILSVSGSMGTHGYIISNKCAKLIYTLPILTHIDSQLEIWIDKFALSAYSSNPLLITTFEDRETDIKNSNLSETFPLLLNSVLHQIPFSDDFYLDWSLSENFMKIGPFNINAILLVFVSSILFLPRYTHKVLGLWLLIEFLVSLDLKNTIKFVVFGFIAFFIRNV
jgi:GR25 family glycosyltransferase involved in LPS biosynthesis